MLTSFVHAYAILHPLHCVICCVNDRGSSSVLDFVYYSKFSNNPRVSVKVFINILLNIEKASQ